MSSSNYLPWIEKYRPCSLSEIKGHVDIVTVLERYGGVSGMPNLLFYGPPGSGKTSTILSIAKEFYKENFNSMVMEVNASDERGISVVTGKIKSFVQTVPLVGSEVKLVLLDEADALTVEAQSALRRIMENNTRTARFCLCCNYSNKISTPIQSRCTKFRFSGIDDVHMKEKMYEIIKQENILIQDSAIESIVEISNGDARRVINLLQSLQLQQKEIITPEKVYKMDGSPLPSDIETIYTSLLEKSFKESFYILEQVVVSRGYTMADIVTRLSKKLCFSDNPKFMEDFSNIEYNLSEGGSEILAVGHLVSCFH